MTSVLPIVPLPLVTAQVWARFNLQDTATLMTSVLPIVPLPLVTAQVWTGLVGCVNTVTL